MKSLRLFLTLALVAFAPALHAQVPQLLNYQGRIAVGSTNFDGTGQFKFALVDSGTNASQQAAGESQLSGGRVTAVTVTVPGSGYLSPPAVTISGGGGSGATATATVSAGVVTGIIMKNQGSGYLIPPAVTIAPPPPTYPITLWSNDGTTGAYAQPTASVPLTVTKGLYSVLLGDTAPPLSMAPIPSAVFANSGVWLRVWFNDGVNGFQQLAPDQRIASTGYAMMADSVKPGAISAAQLAPGTLSAPLPVSDPTNTAVPNTTYTATGTGTVPQTFYLPTTAEVGDVVTISGQGTAGWNVFADGGQSVTGIDLPGLVWTPRESNRNWISVASSADGTKLAAVAFDGNIYTSINSGVSWTPRESVRRWNSVASSANGTKLVASVSTGELYTSTNAGLSWVSREGNRLWTSVASSADGTKLVASASSGQLYTSTDSGVSWTPRESNRSWSSVASSADGTRLVAVVYGGGQIYTSTDSGVSWTPRENNRYWNSVASSADGSKLVAVVQGGQPYTSSCLTGGTGQSGTFCYLGNGQWTAVRDTGTDGVLRKTGDTMTGNLRMSDSTDILLRGGTDLNHGLGWYGAGKLFASTAPDGPVLYGYSGGALGSTSGGQSIALSWNSPGNVGIGRAPATNKLEVAGEASKTTAGSWLANSDRRIKQDIHPIGHALETLDRVRLVDFRYTDDYRAAHPGIGDMRYMNVIAQEFAEVFPDHVKSSGEKLPDGSEILQVDTYPLTIYSAAAVQELHMRLKEKDAELADLKVRLEKLEALISKEVSP